MPVTVTKKYADYSHLIDNFGKNNTAVMRHVLFEPQLFGPLVCLGGTHEDFSNLGKANRIGTFKIGVPKLGIFTA